MHLYAWFSMWVLEICIYSFVFLQETSYPLIYLSQEGNTIVISFIILFTCLLLHFHTLKDVT